MGEKQPGRPNNTANGKSLRGWRRVLSVKKKRAREKKFCKEMTNPAWEVSPALLIGVPFYIAGERAQTERSAFEGPAALNQHDGFSLQNLRQLSANEHLCQTKPSG